MRRVLCQLIAIILAIQVSEVLSSTPSEVRYDNYHLYNVFPTSLDERKVLLDLENQCDSLIFLEKMPNRFAVIVSPHKVFEFKEILQHNSINYELDTSDVQNIIDAERQTHFLAKSDDLNWRTYNTLPVIYDWMRDQVKRHPEVASLKTIGRSYEKRELLALKISHKRGNKAIFIEGGMHAREWISPAVTTYLIDQLLNNKNSSEMQRLAQTFDWYFVVVANPDGYVYTHETDRLWRKTRKPYRNCVGADPNRNFNISWGEKGASDNPCRETYAGNRPFSEIEVESLANYVSRIQDLRLYISFHSYSQLILLPYAHTEEVPDNNDDLLEIAQNAVNAIGEKYGSIYKFGNTYDLLYPASGSSMDWVRAKTKTELSFCYELRPKYHRARSLFDLPPEEIIPTAEETIDSVREMIRSSVQLGYFD